MSDKKSTTPTTSESVYLKDSALVPKMQAAPSTGEETTASTGEETTASTGEETTASTGEETTASTGKAPENKPSKPSSSG